MCVSSSYAKSSIISSRSRGLASPARPRPLSALRTEKIKRCASKGMSCSRGKDARAAWACVGGLKEESRTAMRNNGDAVVVFANDDSLDAWQRNGQFGCVEYTMRNDSLAVCVKCSKASRSASERAAERHFRTWDDIMQSGPNELRWMCLSTNACNDSSVSEGKVWLSWAQLLLGWALKTGA